MIIRRLKVKEKENLNVYSLVQSIQKSLRLLTVAIKNIAVSVLFQLVCMPCNWHSVSIRWTALKVQNWLPSKCDPLWENRPLWKKFAKIAFLSLFDAKFNGDHYGTWIMLYICYTTELWLKKWTRVTRQLAINFWRNRALKLYVCWRSMFLYTCTLVRVTCGRFVPVNCFAGKEDDV